MLQSGELWNIYLEILGSAQDALRDFEQIRQDAVTAPGIDVSRQAALARDRLAVAVEMARKVTHPAVVQ